MATKIENLLLAAHVHQLAKEFAARDPATKKTGGAVTGRHYRLAVRHLEMIATRFLPIAFP